MPWQPGPIRRIAEPIRPKTVTPGASNRSASRRCPDCPKHGLVERYGTVVAGLAMIAVFVVFVPNFATAPNLINVLKDTSFLAILALGFALALIVAELDLSVADIASLGAVMVGWLVQMKLDPGLAVLATRPVAPPLAAAATQVAGEWMAAWHLDGHAYADIAADVRAFTEAFVRNAQMPGPATQQAIHDTTLALDAALARHGTTLADQMAWRSQCAHGWWDLVVPSPPDLPNRPSRPGVPTHQPGTPFWQTGGAPHCAP